MMSINKIGDLLRELLVVNPEVRRLFFPRKEYLMICFFKKGADFQMRTG